MKNDIKMNNDSDKLFEEAKKQFQKIVDKPLVVSVLGQTGVGKSSLVNALFGTDLKTGRIKPCTKEIEKVEAINEKGFKMWFYDMPGLGESEIADAVYFEQYIAQIKQADIILWAIHIDNRSFSFDLGILKKIIESFSAEDRKKFINSLTFVLTKADMLCQPPWIFALNKSDSGIFAMKKELRSIFEAIVKRCFYNRIQI